MLIALDPQSSIPVVLEKYKEMEDPPTFLVRFPSARKAAQLKEFIKNVKNDEFDEDKEVDIICKLLEPYVVGWKNVSQEYSPSALGDVLIDSELYELLAKIAYGRIDPETAKN